MIDDLEAAYQSALAEISRSSYGTALGSANGKTAKQVHKDYVQGIYKEVGKSAAQIANKKAQGWAAHPQKNTALAKFIQAFPEQQRAQLVRQWNPFTYSKIAPAAKKNVVQLTIPQPRNIPLVQGQKQTPQDAVTDALTEGLVANAGPWLQMLIDDMFHPPGGKSVHYVQFRGGKK